MAFKDPKLKRMGHLTKSFDLKIVLLHLHSVIIRPLTAYQMNPTFIFSFPSISFSKHKINLKCFRRCYTEDKNKVLSGAAGRMSLHLQLRTE